jgi:hypothetical protein
MSLASHLNSRLRAEKVPERHAFFLAGVFFQAPRQLNESRLPSAEIKECFLFLQASHFLVIEVSIQIDGLDDGFRQAGSAKPNSVDLIQGHDLPREEVLLALPMMAPLFVLPRTIRAARTLTLLAPDG